MVTALEAARDAGQKRPDLDMDLAAEWIIRIVVSLVTMPGESGRADRARQRQIVEAFVVASLR